MDKIAITCILQVFFGLDLKTIKELQGPMLLSPVSDHLDPTGSEKRAFDAWKCAEIEQTHWPIRIPTNTGYYYMITIHLVPQQVRCFFITLFFVCRDFEISQLGDLLDLGDSGRSFAQQGRWSQGFRATIEATPQLGQTLLDAAQIPLQTWGEELEMAPMEHDIYDIFGTIW